MNTSDQPEKLRFAVLALAVVTAGAATLAMAQPPRPPIDVAELENRAAEAFASADTDSDGLVTLEEFTAVERPGRGEGKFRSRSGKRWGEGASEEDRAARRDAMSDDLFDLLDSNADDSLSREEFSAANQRTARHTLRAQRAFARFDRDSDGVLTIEEFPASRLKNLDSDGDGTITREELKQGRASQRLRNS